MTCTKVTLIEGGKESKIELTVNITIEGVKNIELYKEELRRLANKTEGQYAASITELLSGIRRLI